ncbi:hypothetical protein WJX72_001276 [[Myrmecia] bisecta]|uniref:SAND domain-containing protein n=1 Tax=[Myrmecia] bisecta TaxID=41462 RepID=A0AAW1Q0C3_9CHLO
MTPARGWGVSADEMMLGDRVNQSELEAAQVLAECANTLYTAANSGGQGYYPEAAEPLAADRRATGLLAAASDTPLPAQPDTPSDRADFVLNKRLQAIKTGGRTASGDSQPGTRSTSARGSPHSTMREGGARSQRDAGGRQSRSSTAMRESFPGGPMRPKIPRSPPGNPDLHPILRMGWQPLCEVHCNGLTGKFLGGHDKELYIQCTGSAYADLPLKDASQGGCIMSCSQFEKAAGRELSKKWKESIHVTGEGEGSRATLVSWLKRRTLAMYGEGVVGKSVWVCWSADVETYQGTIISFSKDNGKHKVRYSDRFVEELHLPAELLSFGSEQPELPFTTEAWEGGQQTGTDSAADHTARVSGLVRTQSDVEATAVDPQESSGGVQARSAPVAGPAGGGLLRSSGLAALAGLGGLQHQLQGNGPLNHQNSGISVNSNVKFALDERQEVVVRGERAAKKARGRAASGGSNRLGRTTSNPLNDDDAPYSPHWPCTGQRRLHTIMSEDQLALDSVSADSEDVLRSAPKRPRTGTLDAVARSTNPPAAAIGTGDGPALSPSARFQTVLVYARQKQCLAGYYEAMLLRYGHFKHSAAQQRRKLAEFVVAALHQDVVEREHELKFLAKLRALEAIEAGTAEAPTEASA